MSWYEGFDEWRHVPFSWTDANCCHFCKDMVQRQGVTIEIPVPSVADEKEAKKWLHAQGHRSLYHLMVSLFGMPVAPLQARRGDVVYKDGSIGIADRYGWFLSDTGLIAFPLSKCRWAFRVK
jgi:hypothetical protein